MINTQTIDDILDTLPKNQTILDNMIIAYQKINSCEYDKISCSISGGADSDLVLDICHKCDKDKKIQYVWFDTGLEYEATKQHLKYLEEKYGIEIVRVKAKKPIPIVCKTIGQPFISKHVSEMISRLQKHGFDWVDEPFDILYQKYPRCKIALMWWCNQHESDQFNIRRTKWLKEFMVSHPPTFKVSQKCCDYAKKKVIKDFIADNDCQLNIYGVRKAEGGARSTAYKSCFSESDSGCDDYRPLFWYTDSDKFDYEQAYNIQHSECYSKYGLRRTGCAGCPFGRDFESELEIIKRYEPKLYIAANNIFRDSYEYTRKYKEYCEHMQSIHGSYKSYLRRQCNR